MKQRRKVDPKLLENVRAIPCMACLSHAGSADAALEAISGDFRSHPHHLISVKSGGPDVAENVMPLCPKHHSLIHQQGLDFVAEHFALVKRWLEAAQWKFSETKMKWVPPFRIISTNGLSPEL